jgi:hypothetical protein
MPTIPDSFDTVIVPRQWRPLIPGNPETTARHYLRTARDNARFTPSVSPSLRHALEARNRRSNNTVFSDSFRRIIEAISYADPDGVGGAVGRAAKWRVLQHPALIGHYFSYRESQGLVSYLPTGKDHQVNDDGTWKRDGRQSIKPAKFAKALLHPVIARKFKDHDFARFATLFKVEEDARALSVKRVSVETAYTGSVPFTSCMQDEPVDTFYSDAGVTECVAVYSNHGADLVGRALIWERDGIIPDCSGFIDRIYGDEAVTELLIRWADENGFAHKQSQSGHSSALVKPNGDTFSATSIHWKCRTDIDGDSFIPYLDTLYYYDEDDRTLNASDCRCSSNTHELRETNGTWGDSHEGEVQDVDGNWIDEEDAYYVNGDYYSSDDERIGYCERSEEYYLASELYSVEVSRNNTIIIHESYVSNLA